LPRLGLYDIASLFNLYPEHLKRRKDSPMARLVHPVSGSTKKVYIASKGGTAVTVSSRSGEAVEVVDSRAAADGVVTVYVGGKRVSTADAKRFARACLREQERQRQGKRDKGVFAREIADLEGGPPKAGEGGGDGLRLRHALALAALTWVGLSVYVGGEEGAGVGLLALLLGVAMVPAIAMVFKFMDLFLPGSVIGLAALGLAGLSWGAALGFVDVEEQTARPVSGGQSAPKEGGAVTATKPALGDEGKASEEGPRIDDWPSAADAYTVIVASKPDRARAAIFAARLPEWATPAGLLRSDDYTTLLPGYWVAFGGRFANVDAAFDAAERLRRAGFVGAFAELISRKPQDPAGTITAASLGSLRVGMSMKDVRRYVTRPDAEEAINFSAGPAPEIDWNWHFDGGDLKLQFDRRTGRLARFEATTDAVATSSGLTVGDSFAPIRERYGGQLRASPLGGDGWVLSEGSPGSYPALVFSLRDGAIAAIAGGLPRPAGE
jgi:hypothetical protein